MLSVARLGAEFRRHLHLRAGIRHLEPQHEPRRVAESFSLISSAALSKVTRGLYCLIFCSVARSLIVLEKMILSQT